MKLEICRNNLSMKVKKAIQMSDIYSHLIKRQFLEN